MAAPAITGHGSKLLFPTVVNLATWQSIGEGSGLAAYRTIGGPGISGTAIETSHLLTGVSNNTPVHTYYPADLYDMQASECTLLWDNNLDPIALLSEGVYNITIQWSNGGTVAGQGFLDTFQYGDASNNEVVEATVNFFWQAWPTTVAPTS